MSKAFTSMHKGKTAHSKKHPQAGFSIIELVIALALLIIVSGAVFGLMKAATADRFSTNQHLEILQNLRVAMNAIERDALDTATGSYPHSTVTGSPQLPQNALHNIMSAIPTTPSGPDFLVPLLPGQGVNPVGACNTDQVTFIYKTARFRDLNNNNFNAGDIFDQTNNLIIQSFDENGSGGTYRATISNNAQNNGATNTVCQKYDLYLYQTNGNYYIFVMSNTPDGTQYINFANTDPLSFNHTPSTGGVFPASSFDGSGVLNGGGAGTLSRIRMVTFYVASDGTLYRRTYGADVMGVGASPYPGYYDEPLAYNINNMQVLYTMKDGTTTQNPLANGNVLQNMQNVRQVSISLTAQSPQFDPRINSRPTFTVSDTFAIRNLDY
jgi:type II secretory pathway pseudopilin PulG